MKNIVLLGATGSVGESALQVLRANSKFLNLYGISFGKNIEKANSIIQEFKPTLIHSSSDKKELFDLLKNNQIDGYVTLENLILNDNVDIIISAISGFEGLEATMIASKSGKKILLANKESIVVAGEIIMQEIKKSKSRIIPIDSEHNAIYQCLMGNDLNDVDKILITASGGPFNNLKLNNLKDITVDDALNHPTWSMGKKISIDSATLVNKCLELIEAKHLFNISESQIELVIHPQSIIHSIITFVDGSSLCQMSNPDMRIPIANALAEVHRLKIDYDEIKFNKLELTFKEFPSDRKRIEEIAREVCNIGGLSGTVFNASNEIAVKAFLDKRINFVDIYEIISRTFDAIALSNIYNIESIYETDKQARIKANMVVESLT